MLRALTHKVSPQIVDCELTFVERAPIDYELASHQHDAYVAKLAELGVSVTDLCENEGHPDCSFVEDTAIVLDEIAVICSMGVASRRGETALIAGELSKYRELAYVSLPATIEGGDVLRVGRRILAGISSRTNSEGLNELVRITRRLGYEVTPIRLKRSLHLKSACTEIDDETLFVNSDWVETDSLTGFRLVSTPTDEPDSANLLRIGSTVCVQKGFPKAFNLIERIAERVEVVDMSELRKAEAGLTCCSIVFESGM